MSAGHAERMYASLPGLYRDQDASGALRRLLELLAGPLDELHASIEQLYEDLFVETAQPPLIPLLGALVGATVDASLPVRVQREQVRDAIRQHRSKGPQDALRAYAEGLSGWRLTSVDCSQRVARAAYVEALNPVARVSGSPPVELGGGRFSFRRDAALEPLFDALTGRAITRAALAAAPAAYAGVEGRFTLADRGEDLFDARACVAADLSDAAAPPALAAGEVAVDPELSRFVIAEPAPLAGNLRATFHALAAAATAQTVSLGSDLARRGRSDDPLPYTLDLRAPADARDRAGHHHFDNHALFVTPAQALVGRRPNVLPPGTRSGRFTFDDRPLALADAAGVPLQLLDGIDGAPLTRRRLAAELPALAGTPRGFAIRVADADVSAHAVAADLSDFDAPRDPDGAPLTADVAVDPQLGRLLIDGADPDDVRVDYLLGVATPARDAFASRPPGAPLELVGVAPGGEAIGLLDAFDGTPIAAALRLGAPLSRFHGTPRGWLVRREDADVSAELAPLVLDLSDVSTPVPAGRLGVDPERGRFRFPPGALAAGDRVTISFAFLDAGAEAQVFERLTQHLPAGVPAGVVAVVADARARRPAVRTEPT